MLANCAWFHVGSYLGGRFRFHLPHVFSLTYPLTIVCSDSAGTTSVTTTTPTPSVQHMNGATDLVNSYEDASRKASAPDFVPRSIQSREFIGKLCNNFETSNVQELFSNIPSTLVL